MPHSRILDGLHQLATFLLAQIAILEDAEADDKQRKAVYDKIPNDVVRDPSGLAKELEWRVEREMPNGTIDEETTRIDEKPSGGKSKGLVAVKKNQRGAMPISRTWQFDPK